jgi:hypothetical protein
MASDEYDENGFPLPHDPYKVEEYLADEGDKCDSCGKILHEDEPLFMRPYLRARRRFCSRACAADNFESDGERWAKRFLDRGFKLEGLGANSDRSGVRTFRSGNIYAVVTAGSGRHGYHVRLFSRRGGVVHPVKDDGERGAGSAPDAAFAAMRDHSGMNPQDFVFEKDERGWPDFSRPLVREVTDYSRTVALDGLGSLTTKLFWTAGSLDGVEGHRIARFSAPTPAGRVRYYITAKKTEVNEYTWGLSKITFAAASKDRGEVDESARVNSGAVLATIVDILQTWVREENAQYIGYTPISKGTRDPLARDRVYAAILKRVAPRARRAYVAIPGVNDTHVFMLHVP